MKATFIYLVINAGNLEMICAHLPSYQPYSINHILKLLLQPVPIVFAATSAAIEIQLTFTKCSKYDTQ